LALKLGANADAAVTVDAARHVDCDVRVRVVFGAGRWNAHWSASQVPFLERLVKRLVRKACDGVCRIPAGEQLEQ
jgi:hypothetical protein